MSIFFVKGSGLLLCK